LGFFGKLQHSLLRQVTLRLAYAIVAVSAILIVLAVYLYRDAKQNSVDKEMSVTKELLSSRIVALDERWSKEAARLKMRIEHSKILDTKNGKWDKLYSFLIVMDDDSTYNHIAIFSKDGKQLFERSHDGDGSACTDSVPKNKWVYDKKKNDLHMAFVTPLWLGDEGEGTLVFYRSIDNATLVSQSFPRCNIHLVWQNKIAASSAGSTASGQMVQDLINARPNTSFATIQWPTITDEQRPHLLAELAQKDSVSLGNFVIVFVVSLSLLGLALWSMVGFWLTRTADRMDRLAQAAHSFGQTLCVSDETRRLLSEAKQSNDDEIGALAESFLKLTGIVIERDNERAQKEQVLAESEARIREITAKLADGIYVVDKNYRVTFVNEKAKQLLGYSEAEIVGQEAHALFHLDQPGGGTIHLHECAIHNSIAQGIQTNIENEYFKTKDGRFFLVSIVCVPIIRDGQTHGAVITFSDLTIQNKARKKEQESHQNIANLLDLNQKIISESTSGIELFRASGECVLVNDAVAKIVGGTKEQLLGQNFRHISSWKEAGLFGAAIETIETKSMKKIEVHATSTFDKEFWIECDFVYFELNNEPHILLVINDILEYKKAQDILEYAKQEAEAANRSKSEFLANMSHEIRTPLNAVIGLSQLMMGTDLNTKQLDHLGKILFSSKSLLSIINDLLDYSKIEANKIELDLRAIDLVMLLESLKGMFDFRAAEKSIIFTLEIDENIPYMVIADSLRLERILANLLSNAIKFTDKGTVQLCVSLLGIRENKARIRFCIHDSGMGISQEQIEKLFTAFSQADGSITRKYGGTGLGLAICKKLVEIMDGEIGVTSEVGKGSSFCFELELAVASQSDIDEDTIPREELEHCEFELAKLNGKRILLVEDNALNTEVAMESLDRLGMIVVSAINGLEAVNILKDNVFDAVLMDLQMPVMDGLEATKRIREQYTKEELPIIAVTASALHRDRNKCFEIGMNDYISKPFDIRALGVKLSKYLSADGVKTSVTPAHNLDEKHSLEIVQELKTALKNGDFVSSDTIEEFAITLGHLAKQKTFLDTRRAIDNFDYDDAMKGLAQIEKLINESKK
jgi:PAS domain S-box-containing protein